MSYVTTITLENREITTYPSKTWDWIRDGVTMTGPARLMQPGDWISDGYTSVEGATFERQRRIVTVRTFEEPDEWPTA